MQFELDVYGCFALLLTVGDVAHVLLGGLDDGHVRGGVGRADLDVAKALLGVADVEVDDCLLLRAILLGACW